MSANEDLLGLVADIVSAHVSNNSVSTSDVPGMIRATYDAMASLGEQQLEAPAEKPEPAVTARKSLANPNHILSMIDGKPYTMLKRHLSQNGLTPAEYRERYDLPSDYPMTSKNYSERRRELAHSFGLGKKKDAAEAACEEGRCGRRQRRLSIFTLISLDVTRRSRSAISKEKLATRKGEAF